MNNKTIDWDRLADNYDVIHMADMDRETAKEILLEEILLEERDRRRENENDE